MSTELKTFNFEITSLDQAMQYAKLIADSDLAPKDYKGKSGNVLIAIQYGNEIGLKPIQAIQNIAVINGRPCVWGDAMIAVVQNHPLCEYIKESFKDNVAYCTVKRRNEEQEYTYSFSKEDAKVAGLLSKAGVWQQYPSRMCQMRARAFALRDKFSDVLKGIAMREEVQDYVVDISSARDKNSAAEKITHLIENKNRTFGAYEDVYVMMQDAECIEQLDAAVSYAKNLSDEDKEKARKLYKAKYATFVNQTTGEVTEDVKR